jgi:hypothetical protein
MGHSFGFIAFLLPFAFILAKTIRDMKFLGQPIISHLYANARENFKKQLSYITKKGSNKAWDGNTGIKERACNI